MEISPQDIVVGVDSLSDMWPFKRRKVEAEVKLNHIERLKALEDRWNVIESEWTEWFEKFRVMHLRLARRQKALEALEHVDAVESASKPANGETETQASSPLLAGLSDSAKAWQQKILRQRAGMISR